MAVMKSSDNATLVPFRFEDAEAQAGEIVSRARKQSDEMRTSAARDGRDAGYAEGLQQGRIAGENAAYCERATQLEDAVAALISAAEELRATQHQINQTRAHEAVTLAAAIARRVAKRLGTVDPAVLQENVSEAIKLIVDRSEIRIAIHPSQRATLAEALPRLQHQWPQSKIEMNDDPQISPGGCKVFTGGGMVDADLDTQLDRIIRELLPEES